MKKFVICVLLMFPLMTQAQDDNTSYQEYRNNLVRDYQEFRKGILDDYADFLAGIWYEYQMFRGEKRDKTPKPLNIPNVEEIPSLPDPNVLPEPEDKHTINPEDPFTNIPSNPSITPTPSNNPVFDFKFYDVSLRVPRMKTFKVSSLSPESVSSVWRKYQKNDNYYIIQNLNNIGNEFGLNDWFKIELVRSYANALLFDGTSSDRIVLQHFLLTNLGYDIRLAKTEKQLLLLIPFKQQVYERSFMRIDNHKFYIFFDDISPKNDDSMSLYTCNLPKDEFKGKISDLKIKDLRFKARDDRNVTITDGIINVNVTINCGMMEMLRHYPAMEVPYYAASTVVPSIHNSILKQIKQQIAGMSNLKAANVLLHFVQNAFIYATDHQQHGYEKSYFIEENFYYPKNDCEDRAIFYAFLIHNLLGLDVHLIEFPGHECTAVHFNDQSVRGNGYMYKDKFYTICDPTYIGSSVGQCMPSCIYEKPIIEIWY